MMSGKANVSTSAIRAAPAEYFIGQVTMRDLSLDANAADHKIYHVAFKRGARTKIHRHEGTQILIVRKGKGSLVTFKRISRGEKKFTVSRLQSTRLVSGDIVCIPAGVLHEHGSVEKGTEFAHVAINSHYKGREARTLWYDHDKMTGTATLIP